MLDDSLSDVTRTNPDHMSDALGYLFAPSLPPLQPDQLRFLRLHQQHLVTRHKYEFQGAQLRAFTDYGQTATIAADLLDDLCERGLMEFGIGCADVALTEAGKAWE